MGFWGNMFGAFGGAASSPTPYTKGPSAPTSDTLGGSPASGAATGAASGAMGGEPSVLRNAANYVSDAGFGGKGTITGAMPGGLGGGLVAGQQLYRNILQNNPQLSQLQGSLGQGGAQPSRMPIGFAETPEQYQKRLASIPDLQGGQELNQPGQLQQPRDIQQRGPIQKKTTLFGNRRFSRTRR